METETIAELVERVTVGDPWHGPSVHSLLAGLSAAAAATPGPGGSHSIWELVLHMTGWAREVTMRLGGRPAQEPDGGDWAAVGDRSPAAWESARAALFAAHRDLAAAIRALDPSRLPVPVTDYRDDALGTGLSHRLTLHGLVHHTVYHAGQIAVLKRALG